MRPTPRVSFPSSRRSFYPLNIRALDPRSILFPPPRRGALSSLPFLRVYYFWYFVAVGVMEPFLAPWWRQIGFSSAEIGLLTGIMPATAAVAPFLWTAYADATRRGDLIFRWSVWISALAGLLLPILTWAPAVALCMGVFAAFRAPLIPLANSMTFQALGGRRVGFAGVRLWGTVGYIVTAVLLGVLVDRVGLRVGLLGIPLSLAACGSVAWLGRSRERAVLPPVGLRDILESLRDRRLLRLVAASGLVWVSYGPYATFFTIHLDSLGFSRSFAGLAWALAAGSELAVMLGWSRMAGWTSGRNWFLLALAASPLRWLLAAAASGAPLLLAVQLLHAFSFGVFYLAAVERVDRLAPPGLRATAQGVFAAATFGIGGLLGTVGGGLAHELLGMRGLYLASAAVSILGVLVYWTGIDRSEGEGE